MTSIFHETQARKNKKSLGDWSDTEEVEQGAEATGASKAAFQDVNGLSSLSTAFRGQLQLVETKTRY